MLTFLTPKKNTIYKPKKKMGVSVLRKEAPEFFQISESVADSINKRSQKEIKSERIVLPWNKNKIAFKIRNVLTPNECKLLIQASEAAGYEPAMVNIGGGRQILNTDYRDSYRVMIDHSNIVKAIYDKAIGNNTEVLNVLCQLNESIKPVEINERLRYLKYHVGQKFTMHMDGSYSRPSNHPNSGDRSYFTILIYLNKNYVGSTRLFSGYNCEDREIYDVLPEEGMIFIHQHDILHSGAEILSGTKYAIRSDVLCRYENQNVKEKKNIKCDTKK